MRSFEMQLRKGVIANAALLTNGSFAENPTTITITIITTATITITISIITTSIITTTLPVLSYCFFKTTL